MPGSLVRDPWIVAPCLIAAALALIALGDAPLSVDEAQTGVLARTMLETGLPWADDGVNVLGAPHHPEVDERGLWALHPWLPLVVAAGSMGLFGVGAWQARLPFALLGIGALVLAVWLVERLAQDRHATRLAAWLLAGSVPWILHVRQARYYALAALLALAWIGWNERRDRRSTSWGIAAAVALFHTHYLVFLGTAAGVLTRRVQVRGWPAGLGAGLAIAALAAPWLLLVNAPEPSVKGVAVLKATFQVRFVADLNDWVLPLWLVPLVGWTLWRHPRRQALWALALPLFTTALVVPLIAITPGIRYAVVALVLGPVLLAVACSRWGRGGVVLVAVATATNALPLATWATTVGPGVLGGSPHAQRMVELLGPGFVPRVPLAELAQELATRDDSATEVLSAWLQANLAPGQRALIQGGLEPLAFHADVPLARLVPAGRWTSPHLGPPHLVAYGAEPPDWIAGTLAVYVPGCTGFKGLPPDVHRWLGADSEPLAVLPVAPCPVNSGADPRTHRFAPTGTEPGLAIWGLPR